MLGDIALDLSRTRVCLGSRTIPADYASTENCCCAASASRDPRRMPCQSDRYECSTKSKVHQGMHTGVPFVLHTALASKELFQDTS
jgi:hypothetical protein